MSRTTARECKSNHQPRVRRRDLVREALRKQLRQEELVFPLPEPPLYKPLG